MSCRTRAGHGDACGRPRQLRLQDVRVTAAAQAGSRTDKCCVVIYRCDMWSSRSGLAGRSADWNIRSPRTHGSRRNARKHLVLTCSCSNRSATAQHVCPGLFTSPLHTSSRPPTRLFTSERLGTAVCVRTSSSSSRRSTLPWRRFGQSRRREPQDGKRTRREPQDGGLVRVQDGRRALVLARAVAGGPSLAGRSRPEPTSGLVCICVARSRKRLT